MIRGSVLVLLRMKKCQSSRRMKTWMKICSLHAYLTLKILPPRLTAITSHSQFPNPSLLHDPSNTLPKLCDYPDCQHLLSLEVIKFTCPACHSTYCHSHSGKSSFEMQLDKDGVFDAQKGFWQRVCQRCYENRPG